MNKTTLVTAMGLAIGGASLSANAALTSSSVLVFDDGVSYCLTTGTYPNCSYGTSVSSGSWFSMDTNGDGKTQKTEKNAILSTAGGIHLGTVGPAATGSHSGAIDGSETPSFDIWEFFGGTGMNYLTSAITASDLGGGSWALDLSGWTVTWNGIAAIPMGGDAVNFGTSGIAGEMNSGLALMTCSTASCSDSSTFTLDYAAQVPKGDPSMFGGVGYGLHLEGVIGTAAAVPVPAAAWLFGTGLVGLVGVARRKKA